VKKNEAHVSLQYFSSKVIPPSSELQFGFAMKQEEEERRRRFASLAQPFTHSFQLHLIQYDKAAVFYPEILKLGRGVPSDPIKLHITTKDQFTSPAAPCALCQPMHGGRCTQPFVACLPPSAPPLEPHFGCRFSPEPAAAAAAAAGAATPAERFVTGESACKLSGLKCGGTCSAVYIGRAYNAFHLSPLSILFAHSFQRFLDPPTAQHGTARLKLAELQQ
jgi:hypothetical protein